MKILLFLAGLLMLASCTVTPTVAVEVPPFDQVLEPPVEMVLVVGVYPELRDKGKSALIFKNVDTYILFTDGLQTWITLQREGQENETVKIEFNAFTVWIQPRDKNRPRID